MQGYHRYIFLPLTLLKCVLDRKKHSTAELLFSTLQYLEKNLNFGRKKAKFRNITLLYALNKQFDTFFSKKTQHFGQKRCFEGVLPFCIKY